MPANVRLPQSLCEACRYKRDVVSGKGSRFILCQRSLAEAGYPKYPPQPVVRCGGFAVSEPARDAT